MELDLNKLAGGSLRRRAEAAVEEVLENMLDPNIPAEGKRSVTIKLTLSQTSDRSNLTMDISVVKKLVDEHAIRTNLYAARDLESGQIVAEEYGQQVRGQMDFKAVEAAQETGKNEEKSVVDFRKKRSS